MAYYVISHKGPRPQATLEALPGGLLRFDFPFDYDFLWEFKRIIPSRRAVYTDGEFDYWTVDPKDAEVVADLAEQWGMDRPQVPQADVVDDVDWYDLAAKAAWEKGLPIPELPQVEDDPWDSVG